MGAITWLRIARKVVGLSPLPEHPALETLVQTEGEKPHNDYLLADYIVPPVVFLVTGAVPVILVVTNGWRFWPAFIPPVVISAFLWALFRYLHNSIPPSLRRVRSLADKIGHRYGRFTALVGVLPAIAPRVAEVLDEAAGIYLKHRPAPRAQDRRKESGPTGRIRQAIEDAMARMLELAVPDTLLAQEVALDQGWAPELLGEMRAAGNTLDRVTGELEAGAINRADPLANLREARRELQAREAALGELDIGQR